jgi:hypothetical protein
MAVRTVSILGGNWDAVTTWVGGVVPIANDTVDFTALSGNLTVNVTTATLAGINFTNYVGIITFNFNIVVNTSVNLGTGGYTQAGGGSFGLAISGTTTITSNGVSWNNLLSFFGNTATYTLADNLTVTGNIVLSGTSSITFTGNILYIGGNLTVSSTATVLGTTTFNFNGTGTWSYPSIGLIRNNITIDTLGTLTLSGNIYYNTGTLTYIQGEVIATGSTLNIALATTLNTNVLPWNNVIITSGIQTLTSDLNCQNLTNFSVTINGLFNVNVGGNLTANGITLIGTATIVLIGTGTWTATNGSNTFRIPIIINTNGIISLPNSLYHESGLTYIKGTVKSNNTTITFGGGTVTTLVNLHKLIFKNVIIGASTTIKMNEFFSGSPSLVTNISSTGTTSNYTITFQDGFEKIAKFVDISNCTLSKPLQLLVTTNSKRNSRNSGIRYINQSPNGIAKGVPSTLTQTTYNSQMLINDPGMK